MAALKDRLERFKKLPKGLRIWLMMIPIVIAAILVYSFVISPKKKNIEELRRDVNQVRSMISVEQRLLSSFRPPSKEETGLMKVTNRIITSFKENLVTRNEIYDRVALKARSCNITDISIDPDYNPPPVEEGEGEEEENVVYSDIETDMSLVKLTFHSRPEALGCFLKDIEKKKVILLESLTIKRELPEPSIEIIFRVFAKKSS
ncbi:MAG: hypothetical protein V3V45_02865 [Candidatus Brocadiales bacterium]